MDEEQSTQTPSVSLVLPPEAPPAIRIDSSLIPKVDQPPSSPLNLIQKYLQISQAELQEEYQKLEREEAEAHNVRKYLFFIASFTCCASLICLAIAVNHWAAYTCLLPLAFVIIIVGITRLPYRDSKRKQRIAKKLNAVTGIAPEEPITFSLPALLAAAVSGIFGGLGFWITCRHFYSGGLADPDGNTIQVALALQIYFGIFISVAALLLLILCMVLAILAVRIYWPSTRTQNFDPLLGPDIPSLTEPRYPLVIECLGPFYIGLAFTIVACIGGFYCLWFKAAMVAWVIPGVYMAKSGFDPGNDCRRLELYTDWYKVIAPGRPIDEKVLELTKQNAEIRRKCSVTIGAFIFLWFFGVMPIFSLQRSTAIEDVSWGWLYFGGVFILSNSVIFSCWKSELWELFGAQTVSSVN